MKTAFLLLSVALAWLSTNIPMATTAQAEETPAAPTDLEQIRKQFQERETQAVREVRKQYLAALENYLGGRPDAKDREETYVYVTQIALNLEEIKKVQDVAAAYFKEFPKGVKATDVLKAEFLALISQAATIDQSRDVLKRLRVEFGQDQKELLAFQNALAGAYVKHERFVEACAVYDEILKLDFVKKTPQTAEYFENQKADLEDIGKPFEDFQVKSIDGQDLSVSRYRGKVVLVDFWATWCQPCMQALPQVIELYQKYQAQGLEIIGISLDKDLNQLKKVIQEKEVKWLQAADGQGWQSQLAEKYGIQSIPATFLLDRDGRIYRKDLQGQPLENAVKKLIAKPVSNP